MTKYQWKGSVIVPSYITFLALQALVSWWNIDSSEPIHFIPPLGYTLFLILLINWFSKKDVYNILLGFNPPPLVLSFSIYLGLTVLFINIMNWFIPDFYLLIPNKVILGIIILGFIVFYIYKKNLTTNHVFVRLTPDIYMDLTYNRIHTKPEIQNYQGERNIIEDLHIDNLMLVNKHLKNNNKGTIKINLIKGSDKVLIVCYDQDKFLWKNEYELSDREVNKEEIERIINNIYYIKKKR